MKKKYTCTQFFITIFKKSDILNLYRRKFQKKKKKKNNERKSNIPQRAKNLDIDPVLKANAILLDKGSRYTHPVKAKLEALAVFEYSRHNTIVCPMPPVA